MMPTNKNTSVYCHPMGCPRPIELSDASSLLWRLKTLYEATTSVASDATQFWADIAVQSKSPLAPLANIPGGFAALWTPEVAPVTALTLGAAGFSFVNIPKTLVHFSTTAGARGIVADSAINPSLNMLKNALFGPGIYLARVGRPVNLFINRTSLTPIVISTPAGVARIVPYLVYVRWGVTPLAVNIINK